MIQSSRVTSPFGLAGVRSILACFSLGQDFAGSCAVYPELGDEGSVQVRARDLLGLMSVAVQ